jgi:tRNA pseudouridine13 synthase
VPNYYGEQRFGRGGNNLAAKAMFAGKRIKDRNKRSHLSAARSMLFNAIVSARIEQGLAHQLLAGDCVMLRAATPSSVKSATPSWRAPSGDVQLTAPQWGRGRLAISCRRVEQGVLAPMATGAKDWKKPG